MFLVLMVFLVYFVSHFVDFLGKQTKHHLTVDAKRRDKNSKTKTVTLSGRDVPSRELDLRFISVKLARKLVKRYLFSRERKTEIRGGGGETDI
jgi:hypothetical protein